MPFSSHDIEKVIKIYQMIKFKSRNEMKCMTLKCRCRALSSFQYGFEK